MKLRVLSAICLTLASAAAAQEIVAPSGQTVTLFDVVMEPEAGIARFRFLAPAISAEGGLAFEDVLNDLPWLCETVARPALAANGFVPEQIIVTLADREVPFGQADAGATQFIEGYVIENDACVWSEF